MYIESFGPFFILFDLNFLVGSKRIFVAKYVNKHNRYWLIYENCQMPIQSQERV